jgi:alcohol dehydrogenase class IV
MIWSYRSPWIISGRGSIQALLEVLHTGDRVCLVGDVLCEKLAHTEAVVKVFAKAKSEYRTMHLTSYPNLEAVHQTLKFLRSSRPSWIVGMGGGSVLDVTKTAWALYDNPSLAIEEDMTYNLWDEVSTDKKSRFIAIPTTSGTGTDATSGMVLRRRDGRKFYIFARERLPDFSILDPFLTTTMPPETTAMTGLGALGNAFEAYLSRLSNDFTETHSLRAIRTIFRWLPVCYREPNNIEARERMHVAATMTGVAFNSAYSGLAKAVAEAFSSLFPIPWGFALGISLPYAIAFNMTEKEARERYWHIASALRIEEDGLIEQLTNLQASMNVPTSMKSLVSKEEMDHNFDQLVNLTLEHSLLNRRSLTENEVSQLIWRIWQGTDATP